MDPVALATITSALTLLANEAGKGIAGEAGKDLWTKVRGLLRLDEDISQSKLAPTIAQRLLNDESAARETVRLLQQNAGYAGDGPEIVRNINADKVVLISQQTIGGDFNLSL